MSNQMIPSSAEFLEQQQPRFLIAIQRYETFLSSQTSDIQDSKEAMDHFIQLSTSCLPLINMAQEYDFVSTNESLRGTSGETNLGQQLAQMLSDTQIPDEVRNIYQELYGEEVAHFLQ